MSFWHLIPRPIVGLSPMDGVTDASFRYIAAKHGGPDVVFTEFVNIQSAFYSPHTLLRDLSYSEIERPVVAQIYGRDPELFYKVAHIVAELGFDGLDVNMGCPARKVAASGCGAALIRSPEVARQILRAAKRGIDDWAAGQRLADIGIDPRLIAGIERANAARGPVSPLRRPLPVSVKTRIGYDRDIVDEWMPLLLEQRPDVISLHGRTLEQGYSGSADWRAIARAAARAAAAGILLLGNGDLQDMENARRRILETGVDGVLLGRAAQGNPWIFARKARLKAALADGTELAPETEAAVALDERFAVVNEHCAHYERFSGGAHFVAMRKHLTWYCKHFRGAAELRGRMVRANTAAEVAECFRRFATGTGRQVAPRDASEAALAPSPPASHAPLF